MMTRAFAFSIAIVVAAALAACGGGKSTPTPVNTIGAKGTPGPKLRLAFGEVTEQELRNAIGFIFQNPVQAQHCETFLDQDNLAVEQTVEADNAQVNPNTQKLTPVAADQETAGAIIKDICRQISTATATP